MKQFISVLALLAFLTTNSQNLSDLESFENVIKPGTQLVYELTSGSNRTQITVTIKKWSADVSYDWSASDGRSGSVEMTADAINKANALHNGFEAGPVKLSSETSLVISKSVMQKIAETTEADIKVGGTEDTATLMSNTIAEYSFNMSDNFLSVPALELEGGSEIRYKVIVVESSKFPLIVKVEYGWSLALLEIKPS